VLISINDVTSGTGLKIDGKIWVVIEFQHVKPGKGAAILRTKLRNIKTGAVLERTYRTADKLESVDLDEKKFQYLYNSGDTYHFMDMTNYEEVQVLKDVIGDQVKFLKDHAEVMATCHEHDVLTVSLPTFIHAEIIHTEPGFKGDTATGGTKPGTIDTGAVVQVPLFVNIGDKVKIDTRTGSYVERVK